jgi:hypothetical protein
MPSTVATSEADAARSSECLPSNQCGCAHTGPPWSPISADGRYKWPIPDEELAVVVSTEDTGSELSLITKAGASELEFKVIAKAGASELGSKLIAKAGASELGFQEFARC